VRARQEKCHNQKTWTADGALHASKKEAERWCLLHLLERSGEISDLKRQVEYELIPTQRERSDQIYQKGPKKGQPKEGRVIELPCKYIADFVYTTKTGERVVEDVKGHRDPKSAAYAKFVIKRKLMLYIHHIRIKEV